MMFILCYTGPLCKDKVEDLCGPAKNNCTNGGICVVGEGITYCMCPEGKQTIRFKRLDIPMLDLSYCYSLCHILGHNRGEHRIIALPTIRNSVSPKN